MHIELRSIEQIKPYANNPRNNDAAVDAVAASLKQFGFRQPIVVDSASVIVVGHTRFRAALKLGLAQVPVHVATDLTEAQVRAYRIADNATNELAEWNYELLPIEIGALQEMQFDIGQLGFDQEQLDRIMTGNIKQGLTDPDEVPATVDDPKVERGDLWMLGEHRLLCGDSTDADDVARLVDGEQADLLLTDPPYNVQYVGKTREQLTIDNDAMDDASYRTFLFESLGAAVQNLREGGAYYIFHADSKGLLVRQACADVKLQVRQCLIWVKQTMVMGRQDYQWKHEPCLYGWKEGASHTWLSDRCQTTLLSFDRPSRSEEHPTMKPVAMLVYLIQNSCRPGGIVLDPFGGSGSTLIAAEQTGRRAFLVEIDPCYCRVIIDRWEKFSGKKAERVASAITETTPAVAGAGSIEEGL